MGSNPTIQTVVVVEVVDTSACEAGGRKLVRDRGPSITPRSHGEKVITNACRALVGGSTSPWDRVVVYGPLM